MAGVDSTTWNRWYKNNENKTNQGTNTGSYIFDDPSGKGVFEQNYMTRPLNQYKTDDDGYGRRTTTAVDTYNPNAEAKSAWDSWLNDQLGYYKKLYENALASINQNFQNVRNQANVKRKIGENWIKSNSPYDEGRFYKLGNQNQQTWIGATMNARNEKTRADNQALADYNNQKANARSIYAQKIASLM